MITVSVNISGPGGTLGAPVLVIQEALEKLGFKVTICDDHPADKDAVRKLIDSNHRFRDCTASITTVHCPWGG